MLLFSQCFSQAMQGSYLNMWKSETGSVITYMLTLNPDNTFTFESNRFYASSRPTKTENVNGVWKKRHRLLILKTEGIANEVALAKTLNKSKARLKVYSKRHKKYGKVKPSLKFYKSKVFYAKAMKLFKEDDDIVMN